ncbi:MAG TPA: YgjV family protein [Candidatus Pelethosoma merdigallinarum]|nr:YgjV family protein [Candidatus Pelethosoma merdigallinarum]
MNVLMAQIFALCSSHCLLLSFWQKKRIQILFFQTLDSVFDIIQYFLLGAYTGSCISLLGALRAYTFSKTNHKFFLYLFLVLYTLASILTFDGMISIIPLLAALLYTLVTWNKKEKYIRMFSILVFSLWFLYDILVQAYVSSCTDLVLIISNSLALYKLDIKKG